MSSDPSLLEAFRKQCRLFGPEQALLLWKSSGEVQRGEVDADDLIDIYKEEATRAVDGDPS